MKPPIAIQGSLLWESLFGVGLLAIGVVIAVLVSRVLLPLIGRFVARTKTTIDDFLLAAIKTPLMVFIIAQAAFTALTTLTITDSWQANINKAWLSVSVAIAFWAFQRIANALLNWYGHEIAARTETNWDDQFLPVIRRILSFAILAVGILVVLDDLGIPISPLVAGLGIGGLAVALALQPTLSNFVSGTYVLSDGSIKTGDFIELHGGPSGTVQDVGWRITRIVTVNNNIVIIPNSKLADSVVTNYEQPHPPVIITLDCGVSYESDLKRVEKVALGVMQDLRTRLSEADKDFIPVVRFKSFGDSNINFVLVMRAVNRLGSFVLQHELVKEIHAAFAQERIDISYPVRKLIYAPNGNGGAPLPGPNGNGK